MLATIIAALIGPSADIANWGAFFDGYGTYLSGQSDLVSVLSGGHEVYQEWDGENWVNVDQTHNQPIIPWNPGSNPGGGSDPIADILSQIFPAA
ncbi:hypothetical protein [Hoyosella altamirensis]|uniref:Uncharacterized protein n=1 Tax=Hoyosella altamirensis TaxID=616997 RepID=A0A839RJM2_9ACTN|nr:hypothetical protein [Hoyosella altamirensis]MBB3036374.1 hypothetical protein [Hoyosella altamirensis]